LNVNRGRRAAELKLRDHLEQKSGRWFSARDHVAGAGIVEAKIPMSGNTTEVQPPVSIAAV
jgi:hypothetical protein